VEFHQLDMALAEKLFFGKFGIFDLSALAAFYTPRFFLH